MCTLCLLLWLQLFSWCIASHMNNTVTEVVHGATSFDWADIIMRGHCNRNNIQHAHTLFLLRTRMRQIPTQHQPPPQRNRNLFAVVAHQPGVVLQRTIHEYCDSTSVHGRLPVSSFEEHRRAHPAIRIFISLSKRSREGHSSGVRSIEVSMVLASAGTCFRSWLSPRAAKLSLRTSWRMKLYVSLELENGHHSSDN